MQQLKNNFIKGVVAFLFCGSLYSLIEFIWKYNTNARLSWSMFVLSGLVGIIAWFCNETIFTYETDYLIQVIYCASWTILGEWTFGRIFNTDYSIWDYRSLPLTFADGQLNIFFCIAWMILIAILIPILDYIDWKYFDYMKRTPPYYKINGKVVYRMKNKTK